MDQKQKGDGATIKEALAAMKSCIQSGEPWTDAMQATYDVARTATEGLIEEGWRNCVGYLSEAPSKSSYTMGLPERTGAEALWMQLTTARQRGLTGGEPDTRVQMLYRFMPKENAVIAGVAKLIGDTSGNMDVAHEATRLVVQALLYGPDAALK